ncbi:uncharacterized protein V6R79_010737 [Siganus canaliculatus]
MAGVDTTGNCTVLPVTSMLGQTPLTLRSVSVSARCVGGQVLLLLLPSELFGPSNMSNLLKRKEAIKPLPEKGWKEIKLTAAEHRLDVHSALRRDAELSSDGLFLNLTLEKKKVTFDFFYYDTLNKNALVSDLK